MCDHKLLYIGSSGYVYLCKECNTLQLAFGNICIKITEKRFYSFIQTLSNELLLREFDEQKDVKKVYLNTIYDEVFFVFTIREIETLHTMLSEANLSLQVEKLLQADA